MRPAWRLATNSLSERRSRTALLIITVALCSALIVAVACAMASLHKGIEVRIRQTVGAADLRLEHIGKKPFDDSVVKQIESWPTVRLAVPRAKAPLTLHDDRTGKEFAAIGYGIDPSREYLVRPPTMIEGHRVEKTGQIVLDAPSAKELDAQVGDELTVIRFGEPIKLSVVGISQPPSLGMLARPEVYVTIPTIWAARGEKGQIRDVDILVKPGVDPVAVEARHKGDFARGLLLRVSARITSGLNKNVQSSQIGLVIASVLAFLSAAFIIMTGLTTNVTERQRELAILRCLGGRRAQLAEAQLAVGFIVGGTGALGGIPLGVLGAWIMVNLFPDYLPAGFAMSWLGVVLAAVGATVAGIAGATWPAIQASRTSPLSALTVRAAPPRPKGVLLALLFGLVGALVHVLVMSVPQEGRTIFWLDVIVGMPLMFAGYFLLAVPMTLLVERVFEPGLTRLLRLPRGLLGRTVVATPYRHGFTAGAMMVGLSMLVAIWTNGEAIMRDWLGTLEFPDAFVSADGLTEATQQRIDKIPGIAETCAITLQPMETTAFGIKGLSSYKTTFIAFQPDAFFRMTDVTFVEGNEAEAIKALDKGNAVLVAREFMVAKGMGVGDSITLRYDDKPYTFKIVGVVTSPGLDIVNKYFDIGEDYLEQAVNAVFGTRKDLKTKFGNDSINLIQMSLKPGADEATVLGQVRRVVGFGIVGSGKQVKDEIRKFLRGILLIFSTVAITAMLVSCFGVANLIVAGIQARQFEFGVLRAIGAQRGLLARLVLGEATIVALTACTLGTVMGTQASWAGQRLYEVIIGLVLSVKIPIRPVAVGWLVLALITLGAAWPAAWRLMRRRPRELLAAVKG